MDDDRDVAELVQEVLIDEGFHVTCLYEPSPAAVRDAVEWIEPICVVLDGAATASYGTSWEIAAWLSSRPRPIPTVMLTVHDTEIEEAMLDQSTRAQAARIAAVVHKPFDIDRLAEAVHRAAGEPPPPPEANEPARAAELRERLRKAGVRDLQVSGKGREWATFRVTEQGPLLKIYRWRSVDTYFVGRYSADGRQLEPLAQFRDLDVLIRFCVRPRMD